MSEIDLGTAWHGRLMVLTWAVLLPAGVLLARFCKITPWQRWPDEIDNRFWWRSHLVFQYAGGACMLTALWLALNDSPDPDRQWWVHRVLAWSVIGLAVLQFVSGWCRGSMGGPTDPRARFYGDHYYMTRRRRWFERFHRINGYFTLLLATATILTGLIAAQAPLWMYVVLSVWWALLLWLFLNLQHRGLSVDSYTAIWGCRYPPADLPPLGQIETGRSRDHSA